MSRSDDARPDVESRELNGIRYERQVRDGPDAARGTLWMLDSGGRRALRVPTYPSIARVYRFHSGLRRMFRKHRFVAEEKMDGYNTRIFRFKDRLFATTKGGFLCPFTTEWLQIWDGMYGLSRFLEEHPDFVLCAEVCGDNPYNQQRDPDMTPGAHLFIFDILTPEGACLPPWDRYACLDQYGLPGVPTYGEYSTGTLDDLAPVLLDLNEREREGLVLKSVDGGRALKFVTPMSDLQDIRDNLQVFFDLHPGFFRNRLLRGVLFVREFHLDEEAYMQRFGSAIFGGFDPLRNFRDAHEEYTVYVLARETWALTRKLIGQQVRVRTRRITPATLHGRDMLRVEFRRVFEKSTRRLRAVLRGVPHVD